MPRIVWQGAVEGVTYRVIVQSHESYLIERLYQDGMGGPRWETSANYEPVITAALWSLYQDALDKKGIRQ